MDQKQSAGMEAMKKNRWKRLILIVLLLAAVVFVIVPRVLSALNGSSQTGPAGSVTGSSDTLLPDTPLTPPAMTEEQKQAVMTTARQDAVTAARASGQTDAQALAAGEAMAEAARRAMTRSSAAGAVSP